MEYLSNATSQIFEEVLRDIAAHEEWREEVERGKMFGVLIAEDADGRQHTLKAYSGQILGRSDWPGYVPAIFDYLQADGHFKRHEAEITALNNMVRALETTLPKGKRSAEVEAMKRERREKSQILQRWLFSQFVLTGANGSRKSVLDVFCQYARANGLKQQLPPGGTGECCAPKLLHYANSHGLKPLKLAEFWYGASPKGEVRHHGQCYEPCQAKCQPILWFLAPEYSVQEVPTTQISASDILFEDAWFVAINKPPHLLSVPGKRQQPNAEEQLKALLNRHFLKMAHRLDMDTSGILLAAKTPEAHEAMQRLFATHEEVAKEYTAILTAPTPYPPGRAGDGLPKHAKGRISLPLSPDFLNRPRQCIDRENGKEAVTEYEILGTTQDHHVRILLRPRTGRTHQLRLHCAHADGLNMPILGDPLYGCTPSAQMHLHASRLRFQHPFTHETVEITSPPPF